MVALADDLENKGLVQRRQHPDDRRKSLVALTDAGRATLRKATAAASNAERRFLAPLSDDEIVKFKEALRVIAFPVPGKLERPRR